LGRPGSFQIFLGYNYKVYQVVKLELVCKDADVSRLIDVIKVHAHTGRSGDGMIFVTDVKEAVKIKTGATGEKALE
jgi:nitrogen regulatory protein P-II 1